jgi:hypothetical protein
MKLWLILVLNVFMCYYIFTRETVVNCNHSDSTSVTNNITNTSVVTAANEADKSKEEVQEEQHDEPTDEETKTTEWDKPGEDKVAHLENEVYCLDECDRVIAEAIGAKYNGGIKAGMINGDCACEVSSSGSEYWKIGPSPLSEIGALVAVKDNGYSKDQAELDSAYEQIKEEHGDEEHSE